MGRMYVGPCTQEESACPLFPPFSQLNSLLSFAQAGSSDCMCPPSGSIPIFNDMPSNICKFYSIVANGTHCHFADIYVIDHVCFDVEQASCPGTPLTSSPLPTHKQTHGHSHMGTGRNRTILPRSIQLDLVQEFLLSFARATLIDDKGSSQQEKDFKLLLDDMEQQFDEGYLTEIMYNCGGMSDMKKKY